MPGIVMNRTMLNHSITSPDHKNGRHSLDHSLEMDRSKDLSKDQSVTMDQSMDHSITEPPEPEDEVTGVPGHVKNMIAMFSNVSTTNSPKSPTRDNSDSGFSSANERFSPRSPLSPATNGSSFTASSSPVAIVSKGTVQGSPFLNKRLSSSPTKKSPFLAVTPTTPKSPLLAKRVVDFERRSISNGSEPSLVSARRNGSSKSASKRTLHSEDTLDSSLSPSPAATSNGAATHPLEDITQILNHTGTYNSNGERKTFSGSNSTNTNMTFSNNNPPPPPSGSGSNGNIDVSSPPPNPAGAMSSPTTSTASPKTPSYLKLASSLAGYGNAAYGSPPTQQKKLIVIKRGTSENRHDKEGLGGVLDSEDELDKCDHNGVVLSSRGDKYIVQQNGCVDTNASVNMGEPVGVVVEARKARSRSRSSEPDSHKSRSVTSPDQPLMSPVPVSITIKTKSTTNDSEIVGTTTEVSPLRESSPVPVLNGDVHKDVNGVDEVDFSFTRFHITEKIDDAFSQEEEIEISSPVKDGNYFLAVCNADEEKLKKLIVAVEELQKTQEVINSEDAQGRIAALVGKTNLLINQRFKQFRELCAKNLSQKPGDDKPTLNDDLQGFWDMVLLPVHELEDSFKEIHVLAANGWKMPEVKPPMRVNSRPASARTAIAVPQTAEERAAAKAAKEAKKAKAAEAAKARAEMRKKLMEAKKEAKNKEPAVEIFIA